MLYFGFKKGIWKKKKTLVQWRTTKVIEMKDIVILVKVDRRWNAQNLEKYASHCLA